MHPHPLSMLVYLPLFFFFFLATPTSSLSPPLLTPISKDPSKLQYTTTILHRTPLKPSKFVIDLGLRFSWVDCQRHCTSSPYLPIPCNTTTTNLCSTCTNATCSLFAHNSFKHLTAAAPAISDVLALPSTTGRGAGPAVKLPAFLLSCSPTFMLRGLARGSSGVVALGWANHSLPSQVIATFSLPKVFALCLSGSPSAPGVAFFGTAGPYIFLPGAVDASKSLVYTPLVSTPRSSDYHIAVTSIQINGRRLNTGGTRTRLSTAEPYTKMETSIYKAFTKAFVRAAKAMNMIPTKPVKPFKACFLYQSVGSTRGGPAVPAIDLVLRQHGDEDAVWRLHGENSIVLVNPEVVCLAFVDGGRKQRDAMVVGGHQLEDNLVQFDLGKKRVGFSSSLLLRKTMCANFNFTATAL